MRADRHEYRFKAAFDPLGLEVGDPVVTRDPDSHRRDPLDLRIEHVARQPVGRDPVAHHPARLGAGVADLDIVPEPRQVVGGGEPARARTDDQHTLSGARLGRIEHPAPLAGEVT